MPLVVGARASAATACSATCSRRPDGRVYRLDRHPTMRRHPVTPMDEADLRGPPGAADVEDIALMDILQLSGTAGRGDRRFEAVLGGRPDSSSSTCSTSRGSRRRAG